MQLLDLVWAFFKIGVVSFGGGWSIVGLIRTEVVPRWMDGAAFSSLVAIAQATPGPVALNAATLVGWQQAGMAGAIAATFAVVAFPAAAIAVAGIVSARIAVRRAGAPNAEGASGAISGSASALQEALKTGTLAMMAMTLWVLLPFAPQAEGGGAAAALDPFLAILCAGSFALAAFTKINPLWAILGAGFLNMAFRLVA
jgi:chromate transporter